MSRTDYLTLGIVGVCVLALAFLIYKFVTLNSDDSGQDMVEQTAPENTYSPDEQDTTAFTDAGYGDEKAATDYSRDANEIDDNSVTAVDEYPKSSTTEADTKVNEPAPTAATRPSSTFTEGAYMVLAGSFREKVNAEAMANKVRKLGYTDASVENFNKGAYAVVLVSRFDSYSEADALVKELAGKGVQASVQKKR